MEKVSTSKSLSYKLYKENTIYLGTLLGGPLVAGYLAAENFKAIGQEDKIITTWTISIIATILIFSTIFLIPEIQKLPNFIIPLVYSGIAQFLVKKHQRISIQKHIEKGGQIYSGWRAVWIGLIGTIILIALLSLILFFG